MNNYIDTLLIPKGNFRTRIVITAKDKIINVIRHQQINYSLYLQSSLNKDLLDEKMFPIEVTVWDFLALTQVRMLHTRCVRFVFICKRVPWQKLMRLGEGGCGMKKFGNPGVRYVL